MWKTSRRQQPIEIITLVLLSNEVVIPPAIRLMSSMSKKSKLQFAADRS
jgi:hypothetical protein